MRYAIANWKMNMSTHQVLAWVEKAKTNSKVFSNPVVKVIVCPSFIHIPLLTELSTKLGFYLGSQDISVHTSGSHTGEVAAFQVKDFCRYVIVGHSERSEPLDVVTKKTKLALETGLIPIVCFAQPKDVLTFDEQTMLPVWEDPKNISKNGMYANEPVSNIETTLKEITQHFKTPHSLIYGGSVNPINIEALSKIEYLGGVLVGNASLDFNSFADIIGKL